MNCKGLRYTLVHVYMYLVEGGCKQQKWSVWGGGGGSSNKSGVCVGGGVQATKVEWGIEGHLSHSRVEVVMTWEVGVHDEFLHSVSDTVKEDVLRGRKHGELTPAARQKHQLSQVQ